MARETFLPKSSRFLTMASICIVIAALYFGREVLIPLAVAMLLTFLLAPVVHAVERWRVPRAAAVLLVVGLSFVLIGLLFWMITSEVRDLAGKLESYRGDIAQKVNAVKSQFGRGMLARVPGELNEMARIATSQPAEVVGPGGVRHAVENITPQTPVPVVITSSNDASYKILDLLSNALDYLAPVFKSLIVIVFVIFMLMQREDLRDRLIRLVGHGNLTITTQALDDAGRRVSRYLLAQSMINGSFAVIVCVGLLLFHVPNAPLWALICGILRFIPYIGVWVGAAFPIILSFVVPEGYFFARPFLTIGMFITVELIVGNFVEPWLYGASTGVSSVAILVAAVFWTWLWGAVGLLLSTPLTVILAVSGKYVPALEFLTILLGDQPVLKPHERYYQRLLAEEPSEASDLLDEFKKTMPMAQIYGQLLLPALQMAEHDHARGLLDDQQRDWIRDSVRDEVESQQAQEAALAAKTEAAEAKAAVESAKESPQVPGAVPPEVLPGFMLPKNCVVNVLCLPAHDIADEIAGFMAAHLLRQQGYCAEAMSSDALASEMVESVQSKKIDLIVISALPPGGIAHARYLCKRVHGRLPDIRTVVGLWNAQIDLTRAKERLGCDKSAGIAIDFEKALEMIHQMIQPLLMGNAAPREVTGEIPERNYPADNVI